MAFSLLPLPGGGYSLGFEEAELPAVKSLIQERYGAPHVRDYVATLGLDFGGCRFTFQNDWGDPCLISGDPEGGAILQALYAELTATH